MRKNSSTISVTVSGRGEISVSRSEANPLPIKLKGDGDGVAVLSGLLQMSKAGRRACNAGKMMFAFFDPMDRRCLNMDKDNEIPFQIRDGMHVLWVPVHLKGGSIACSEQLLRRGYMVGWPEFKGGSYVCGMSRKDYLRWLDGGGDSGDPERPRFGAPGPAGGPTVPRPFGADFPISEEAGLVLYNTFWFRKLVSKMKPLPYYIFDCEIDDFERRLLGRVLFSPGRTGCPVINPARRLYGIKMTEEQARAERVRFSVLLDWRWRSVAAALPGVPLTPLFRNAFRTIERLNSPLEDAPGTYDIPFLVPDDDILELVTEGMNSGVFMRAGREAEGGGSGVEGSELDWHFSADTGWTEPGEDELAEIEFAEGDGLDGMEDVPGSVDRTADGDVTEVHSAAEVSFGSGDGDGAKLPGTAERSVASESLDEAESPGIGEGSAALGNGEGRSAFRSSPGSGVKGREDGCRSRTRKGRRAFRRSSGSWGKGREDGGRAGNGKGRGAFRGSRGGGDRRGQ
jgi:hypothetical protein